MTTRIETHAIVNKVLYWLPLPMIGVLNGVFRGLVLMRFLSEFYAKQVSSLLLIILIIIYTAFIFHKLKIKNTSQAWATGIIWVILTFTFEFLLGYFVFGSPVEVMLADYDLLHGKLWILVLISILICPVLSFKQKILRFSDKK